VDHAARSETGHAVNHRRPCEALSSKPFEQCASQRRVMPLIGLAKTMRTKN
jgi:hypothetical protein